MTTWQSRTHIAVLNIRSANLDRRTDTVSKRIKDLLADKRESKMNVDEFLKALLLVLKKLD